MAEKKSLSDTLNQAALKDEKFFGMENFGNTCYFNSIFQSLFHCTPLRERVLQYHAEQTSNEEPRKPKIYSTIETNLTTYHSKSVNSVGDQVVVAPIPQQMQKSVGDQAVLEPIPQQIAKFRR